MKCLWMSQHISHSPWFGAILRGLGLFEDLLAYLVVLGHVQAYFASLWAIFGPSGPVEGDQRPVLGPLGLQRGSEPYFRAFWRSVLVSFGLVKGVYRRSISRGSKIHLGHVQTAQWSILGSLWQILTYFVYFGAYPWGLEAIFVAYLLQGVHD